MGIFCRAPPLGAVPDSLGHPSTVAVLDLASVNYRGQLNAALRLSEAHWLGKVSTFNFMDSMFG
jgi:hypothetical protein